MEGKLVTLDGTDENPELGQRLVYADGKLVQAQLYRQLHPSGFLGWRKCHQSGTNETDSHCWQGLLRSHKDGLVHKWTRLEHNYRSVQADLRIIWSASVE